MYAVRLVTDTGTHRFLSKHATLATTRWRERATLYVLRSDAEAAAAALARQAVGAVSTAVCSVSSAAGSRWHEVARFSGHSAPVVAP